MGIWLWRVIDSGGEKSERMLGRRGVTEIYHDGSFAGIDVVVAEACSGGAGKLFCLVLGDCPLCRTDAGFGSAG
jgi:hypothetical protein